MSPRGPYSNPGEVHCALSCRGSEVLIALQPKPKPIGRRYATAHLSISGLTLSRRRTNCWACGEQPFLAFWSSVSGARCTRLRLSKLRVAVTHVVLWARRPCDSGAQNRKSESAGGGGTPPALRDLSDSHKSPAGNQSSFRRAGGLKAPPRVKAGESETQAYEAPAAGRSLPTKGPRR